MAYRMDMSKEKSKPKALPEGYRDFKIMDCVEQVSKQGNDMFKITLKDMETGSDIEVYAVSTPGKRWFLKQILFACGCAAGEDGVYEWEIKDILNKVVSGLVSNEDEEWINREGKR